MNDGRYLIDECTLLCLEEIIINEITRQFPISTFQYVCVAIDHFESTPIVTPFRMIYIQIILTKVVNKHGWFLDRVTGTCLLYLIVNFEWNDFFLGVQCNYHVTDNDLAWNEFIRRGENDFLQITFIPSLSVHFLCRSDVHWDRLLQIEENSKSSIQLVDQCCRSCPNLSVEQCPELSHRSKLIQ